MRELPVRNLLDQHDRLAYIMDDLRHHIDIDAYRTEGLDVDNILNRSITQWMLGQAYSVIRDNVIDVYVVLLGYLLSEGFAEDRIIRDLCKVDLTVNKYEYIDCYVRDFRNSLIRFEVLRRENDTISYADLIDCSNTLRTMARFLEFDLLESLIVRHDMLKVGRRYNHYIQFSPFLEDYAKKVYERAKQLDRKSLYLLCEDLYNTTIEYIEEEPFGGIPNNEYLPIFRELFINFHENYAEYMARIYIDTEGEEEGLNKFIRDLKTHPLNDRCLTNYRAYDNIMKLVHMYLDELETFDDMKVYWNRYFLILNIFRDLHLDPIEIYMESEDSTSNTELTANGWSI